MVEWLLVLMLAQIDPQQIKCPGAAILFGSGLTECTDDEDNFIYYDAENQLCIGTDTPWTAPGGRYWPLYLYTPYVDGASTATIAMMVKNADYGTEAMFGAGAAGAFIKAGEDAAEDMIFYTGAGITTEMMQLSANDNHAIYGGLLIDQRENDVVLRIQGHLDDSASDLFRAQSNTTANGIVNEVTIEADGDINLLLGNDLYMHDNDSSHVIKLEVPSALTGNRIIDYPDQGGTVCLDSGGQVGCGGAAVVDHIWNWGPATEVTVNGEVDGEQVAEMLFVGTSRYDAAMGDEFCIVANSSVDPGGDVELYDQTNSNVLAVVETPSGGVAIVCDTTFSNLPAARANVVFRADAEAGHTTVLHSAYWVRVPAEEVQGGFRSPLPGPGIIFGG